MSDDERTPDPDQPSPVRVAIHAANVAYQRAFETRDRVDEILADLAGRRVRSAAELEALKERLRARGITIPKEFL